ncbi:uncharacterized protein LOC127844964 [Dreissena polymorpha]|uniref:Mab-21-like HhH/H2TH-like domain-containing protein n=1 Tax=Dreissena polymorpha TaxID=45954 RepID=A0A9D4DVU6_DREPO|nr:uncharacterized protein LOC127844964 [Dreissena polymorpha]KAH3768909.1 hypothetical protein DPMN_170126 [Dreissena polymorpha]
MEFTTSQRSNKKRYRTLETIMEIPEHFKDLSLRMSEVLDDSGAGKDTVLQRRKTFLWRECLMQVGHQLRGNNVECFHFGSQSEGTTTPGLQSDYDFLMSLDDVNIMKVCEDWEAGKQNLLMLHDDITPPQQYLLQAYKNDTPEPETKLLGDTVRKDSGQILWSAEKWKQEIEYQNRNLGVITKAGPSVSWTPTWDTVQAVHVRKPLPEIQHWIDRCRGKHWPPVQLLEAARVAPCFLVPAGHPDSDYKREEWRMSPNLIERMLIFSFNMTQIKCYIVLKLIKKSLFAKIVGDSITSFHCKTLMFYTIERTHPSLWFEHNLMLLLWLCVNVLKKWLQLGKLPHYIIQGVNLFDGKLSMVQQRRLLVYVNSMIKNNLQDVFDIGIDNIGCRLQACYIRRMLQTRDIRGFCLRKSIRLLLKFERLEIFFTLLTGLIHLKLSSNTTLEQDIKYVLRNVFEYSTNERLKTPALEFIKHLYAFQNSIKSSYCLRLQNVVNCQIICCFQYFLNTDVASSRLKLASILYCSGHLQAAARVLEDVESRYDNRVKAVCGCIRNQGERDLKVFANMLSGNSAKGFSELPFASCVRFFRQESYCAPFILLFEMNRNITEEEVAQRKYIDKQWMVNAEVDARPFLQYLKYLTYGGLGERDNQQHALAVLESYICDFSNRIHLHHTETLLNLLGHCYEMERVHNEALYYYRESLRGYGTNNAANWHVRRVLRLLTG